MTRIVSYNLYQCPACEQVHIKPNYGSISSYTPVDINVNAEDVKTCQNCKLKFTFNRFVFLRTESDKPSTPNLFYEREIKNFLLKCKCYILRKKYVEIEELSLSEMYPRLQD